MGYLLRPSAGALLRCPSSLLTSMGSWLAAPSASASCRPPTLKCYKDAYFSEIELLCVCLRGLLEVS